MPFASAVLARGEVGPPAPFSPLAIGNLAAWYNADQQVEAADADVATLVDRSGNGHDFTAGAGDRPQLKHSFIGGKKSLAFVAASTESMTCASGLLNGAGAASYFAVAKRANDPPAGGGDQGPLIAAFTAAGNDSHWPFSDGNIYEAFGTDTRKTVGDPTPSLASGFRIYSVHSAAGDFRAYLDATSIFSTGTNTAGLGTSTRVIAANGAAYFDGWLAELVFFSAALSSGDREKMEGYLAWKYGLEGNLPGAHPYAGAAP